MISDYSIDFLHALVHRLTGKRVFGFRAPYYGLNGLEPDKKRDLQTRLGFLFGMRLFSNTYPGVPGRVHVHDSMLQNDSPDEIAHYIRVGRSAMENIEASLKAAGRDFGDIGACLDMACGYGRILRLLVQRIAPRKITACDLEKEAVRFVAAEFGVRPLYSQADLSRVRFPHNYDLIWIGSLLTHLPPPLGLDLLVQLVGLLNSKGLIIFSTQGPSCLTHVPFYGFMFKDQEPEFRGQMERQGWAYLPYYPQNDPNYGIAMMTPKYLTQSLTQRFGDSVRLVRHKERGWDEHQDAWAFQKV